MPLSKDALYISVSGFDTMCKASFSILTGVLSAPGALVLLKAFIARSIYTTLTVCSLNWAPPAQKG